MREPGRLPRLQFFLPSTILFPGGLLFPRGLLFHCGLGLLTLGGLNLHPRAAWAIGEVSGRLGGVVQTPVGSAKEGLAGVPVTISSPSLIGGERTVTTGDDGSYQFQALPPGSYTLIIRLEGFSPIEQRGIGVLAGQLAPVDVLLSIGQLTERTTIIERRNPILNPESAVATTALDNEKVTKTPVFRQVQSMAQLAPGVGPGTTPSVRGGLSRYSRYLVDGLDTSDIVTGGISSPMNFDSVEQFSLSVGAMDAEYNSLGLVQNMVTRSGGNKFSLDISLTLQPTAFNGRQRYAAQLPQQNGPLLYDNRSAPVRDYYSVNANLGGPIVKDKLWFFSSFQFNYNRAMATIPPFPWYGTQTDTDRIRDTYTYLGRIKLTYQATASTRLALSFNLDRNYISNNSLSTTLTGDAERRIGRGGQWLVFLVDSALTPKLMFQLQAGFTNKFSLDEGVRQTDAGDTDRITASHTLRTSDIYNGVTYLNSAGGWNDETKYRVQVDPSFLYSTTDRTGSHNVKVGVQLAYMRYSHNVGIAGGRKYTDTIPGTPCDPGQPVSYASCSQVTEYPDSLPQNGQPGGGFTTQAQAVNLGFFAQDRWTIKRFLTVVPGFRIDTGLLYDYQGARLASLVGYGPRLSLIYDLFHDRTTLLSAHYGRHNDVGNASIADQGNPFQTSILSRWDSVAKQFVKTSQSGGPGGQLFAQSPTPPKLDEVSAGIRREVIAETVVGIDYTYRKYANLWVNAEVNQIWDPAGLRVVGYANGTAQRIYQGDTPSDAQRTYHGLDLWAQGRPGNFGVVASYTLAFTTGTVLDYFNQSTYGNYQNNPRLNSLFNGPMGDNYRHTLKGAIDYSFGFGLNLSTRLQYRTGAPQWQVFQSPEDSSYTLFRSPRGTSTGTRNNDPTTWAEFKLPDQFTVDVQVMYSFDKLFHQRFDIMVQLYNLLGAGVPFGVDNRTGATLGAVNFRGDNLNAELLLRYRY
jgi:hypothetical protein